MTTATKSQCSETVWPADGRGGHWMCSKPVKAHRDGKPYCAVHDPESVKSRQAKRDARWRAEGIRRAAVWAVEHTRVCVAHAAMKWADDRNDSALLAACSSVREAEERLAKAGS